MTLCPLCIVLQTQCSSGGSLKTSGSLPSQGPHTCSSLCLKDSSPFLTGVVSNITFSETIFFLHTPIPSMDTDLLITHCEAKSNSQSFPKNLDDNRDIISQNVKISHQHYYSLDHSLILQQGSHISHFLLGHHALEPAAATDRNFL